MAKRLQILPQIRIVGVDDEATTAAIDIYNNNNDLDSINIDDYDITDEVDAEYNGDDYYASDGGGNYENDDDYYAVYDDDEDDDENRFGYNFFDGCCWYWILLDIRYVAYIYWFYIFLLTFYFFFGHICVYFTIKLLAFGIFF